MHSQSGMTSKSLLSSLQKSHCGLLLIRAKVFKPPWKSLSRQHGHQRTMTTSKNSLNRREVMRICGMGLLASPLMTVASCQKHASPSFVEPNGAPFEGTDEQLLEEIQRSSFDFFWNEASSKTGQVKDRALANGNDSRMMSSIAATGFGLTSLCIGHHRGYRKSEEILARVRNTLRFIANDLHNEHGFFFHFIHMETGNRWEKCELSSIDSSILLCGVLAAR